MSTRLLFRRPRVLRLAYASLASYASARFASACPKTSAAHFSSVLSDVLGHAKVQKKEEKSVGELVAQLRTAVNVSPVCRHEVIAVLVQLLERDSELGARLLAALPGDTLRTMLVIGTAQEYFGEESVEAQLRSVDKDRDDSISSQEYDEWVESTIRNHAAWNVSRKPLPPAPETENSRGIPFRLWRRVVLSAAVPFAAFGMLDNAIFVTTGDAIDKSVADIFGLSTMAAAALGGVVSGTAGIQVHGLADRMAQQTPLAQPPRLNAAQKESIVYKRAKRMGSAMGMIFGLLVGMAPLLVLSPSPPH